MRRSILIAVGIAAVAGIWIVSGQFTRTVNTSNGPNEVRDEDLYSDDELRSKEDSKRSRVRVVGSFASPKIQEINIFGRTEADRVLNVRAETIGRVVEIPVDEGHQIVKGNSLVSLAMDDRQARLDEAQAQVKYREIGFAAAQALAKKKYSAEVTVAKELAALESANAFLHAIRLDIARTKIRAPFDGVLEVSFVNIGDLVQVGDIVAQLVDLDPIIVAVEISERQVTQVKLGQTAYARFPDGIQREGKVTFISRSGNTSTRTFRVEISIPNIDLNIPQGLTVDVTLLTQSTLAHFISPAVLTLSESGGIGVKIVSDEGIVKFVPVTIIAETIDGIWVLGLPNRVRVITVGQEYVRSGEGVLAVEEDGV